MLVTRSDLFIATLNVADGFINFLVDCTDPNWASYYMGLLKRIKNCNNGEDLSDFRDFSILGTRVGWVHHEFFHVLKRFDSVFEFSDEGVSLSDDLKNYEDRTSAFALVVDTLVEERWVTGWRNEAYPVGEGFYSAPFLEIDRSAVPRFGVSAYGIHINGFVRGKDELMMWIGRRADDKPTYPGMLDNMVAGGQPVGLSLVENLVKECAEEASIPPEIAQKAKPVGSISYRYLENNCVKPDVMFVFDLELPPEFIPVNTDGEVAEFKLLPAHEVMSITSDTTAFKFNCAAVNIDFFIRHGILHPEHPDYIEIQRGLHK